MLLIVADTFTNTHTQHKVTMVGAFSASFLHLMGLVLLIRTFDLGQCSGAEYSPLHVVIRPGSMNKRGTIGPGRVCPVDQYALGFKMKVQPFTRDGDNTGTVVQWYSGTVVIMGSWVIVQAK